MKTIAPLLSAGLIAGLAWSSLPAQPFSLGAEPLWHVAAGTRDYLTFREAGATEGGYREQGLAYNPQTGHVYVVHYSAAEGSVLAILDGADGSHVGFLSTEGIESTVRLRTIRADADGVIYASNITSNASITALQIFRWANEGADPTQIFSGDPSADQTVNIRGYGANMALRGTGVSTEILMAPDFWQQVTEQHAVALFTTADGEAFTASSFLTDATTRFGLGTAFGPGETFWGTRAGQPLREFSLSGTLLREFSGAVVTSGLSAIGIDPEKMLLAGLSSNELWLYDLSTLSTEEFNPPLGSRSFPTNNLNVEATGQVDFGNGVIFALHTNNGVAAFQLIEGSEPPPPPDPVDPGHIYWTNADALRTADPDGSNPRTVVPNLARPIGVAIDAENNHVYWAEDQAGLISRANLDGTEREVLISGQMNPQGLVIDPSGGKLYWVGFSTGLHSANLDGSGVELVYSMEGQQTTTVSFDAGDNWVYFGSALGTHYRVRPDGTEFETVTWYAANTYGAYLDTEAQRLYYSNFSDHIITAMDLPWGSPELLIGSEAGLHQPLHLVLNEEGTVLYWVERASGQPGGGRVRSAPIDNPTAFTTLVDGENSPFGVAVMPTVEEPPPPSPYRLQTVWTLAPGDRDYLTDDSRQRGLGYNPVTGHLIVPDRHDTIAILDAATGAHVGTLSNTGIDGGTFFLNHIVVAEDGAIYGANLTTDASANPLKVYRWASEAADPVLVYEGHPNEGAPSHDDPDRDGYELRFGDTMAVRGSGMDTQILMAPRFGIYLTILTPEGSMETFVDNRLITDITTFPAGWLTHGLAFGPGDTFFGKRQPQFGSAGAERALLQVAFDLGEGTGTVIGTYGPEVFPNEIGPIGIDVERMFLVGLDSDAEDQTWPRRPAEVSLYDLSTLNPSIANHPLDTKTFGGFNWNGNGAGQVVFGQNDMVYVLDTNNGIAAFRIVDEDAPTPSGFAGWAAANFPGVTDEAIIGPSANPSGNGVPNLIKYVLAMDPNSASLEGLPVQGTTTEDDKEYLTLTFATADAADDAEWEVLVSGSVEGDWTADAVEVSRTPNGDGTTTWVYRDSVAISEADGGRRFMLFSATLD